ncbi:MAG TPA: HAMP domain-containing sensor histidine kinase [Actinomycetota bacterium]|nr:HAMP domain-containing sensor histidine kinase [Actinomycetota bacterium]
MDDAPRFAEMISKIAHELRSPLTSIKGFSATLVKRWDRFTDEQRFQFVETINADADRMGRIVSEVLDLARLETGRFELHPTLVDVGAVLASGVQGHSALPGAERVAIDRPDGLKAWADAERLGHIVSNLVENAIKFSDDGPIRVSARRDGDRVRIEIADEGLGIADEQMPTLFSGPAPAGGAATPSGTGLGLYLTRRLIDAHDGTIEVTSELGKGSVFVVLLPADAPADDD